MEGAQLGLEAVLNAIFDGSVDYGKTDRATQLQIHNIFWRFHPV
jgi:exportin-5